MQLASRATPRHIQIFRNMRVSNPSQSFHLDWTTAAVESRAGFLEVDGVPGRLYGCARLFRHYDGGPGGGGVTWDAQDFETLKASFAIRPLFLAWGYPSAVPPELAMWCASGGPRMRRFSGISCCKRPNKPLSELRWPSDALGRKALRPIGVQDATGLDRRQRCPQAPASAPAARYAPLQVGEAHGIGRQMVQSAPRHYAARASP